MDAQDFRSLREAYLEVVENQQLDEALTGERYKKVMKKPGGMAYSRKVSADPSKRATRGGRGGESDFGAGDRGSGNRAARRAGTYREYQEGYDLYDIILSHLLDEGYAETIESAEAIMVNMSEDWRYDILEEVIDEENERRQTRAAARNMIDRHRTMTKGVDQGDRTGPQGWLSHRGKTERPTTLRNTSSAGQRRAAARNMIDRR